MQATEQDIQIILETARQTLGFPEGEDWLGTRSVNAICARLLVVHALREESNANIGRVLRLNRTSIYHYRDILKDIPVYPLQFKKEISLMDRFGKLLKDAMSRKEPEPKEHRDFFWECENGYYTGLRMCRCDHSRECPREFTEPCPDFKPLQRRLSYTPPLCETTELTEVPLP